jgi:hypothetical protein
MVHPSDPPHRLILAVRRLARAETATSQSSIALFTAAGLSICTSWPLSTVTSVRPAQAARIGT